MSATTRVWNSGTSAESPAVSETTGNLELLERLTERCARQDRELAALSATCDRLREAAGASSEGEAVLRKLVAAKDQKIAMLQELSQRLRAQTERQAAELAAGSVRATTELAAEHARASEALESRARKLALRERTLRAHTVELERGRAELNRAAQALAEELTTAQALHPLHDYLALTESELTKTEFELKRTPTSSEDRPKLEGCLVQLDDQRRFLKALLEASRQKAAERASAVALIQSSTSPVFPLPPSAEGDEP